MYVYVCMSVLVAEFDISNDAERVGGELPRGARRRHQLLHLHLLQLLVAVAVVVPGQRKRSKKPNLAIGFSDCACRSYLKMYRQRISAGRPLCWVTGSVAALHSASSGNDNPPRLLTSAAL